MTARAPSANLGRLAFWLMFVGFNVTFLIIRLTGLVGMPRRVFTYSADMGWEWMNLVSTVGGFVLAAGTGVLIVDVLLHFLHGRRTDGNRWKAGTLEWAVPPGVPPYNFASIPRIASRDPLWEQPDLARDIGRGAFYLADSSSGRRETLGTSVIDGEPEQVICLSNGRRFRGPFAPRPPGCSPSARGARHGALLALLRRRVGRELRGDLLLSGADMTLLAATTGLIVWLGYFVVMYLAADLDCAAGGARAAFARADGLLIAMISATLLALVLVFVFGGHGWRLRRSAAARPDEALSQRMRFHGLLAVGVAIVATTATVWVALPLLIVEPCR